MCDLNKRPHGREQVVEVAQEVWEDLPGGTMYDAKKGVHFVSRK